MTKTKKTVKKITLRTLLGRLQNRCDLIVADGLRYWQQGMDIGDILGDFYEMDNWRFHVTELANPDKDELRLIHGASWHSFNLNQPIKKGKGHTVRLKSVREVSLDIGFISLQNLIKWDPSVLK